MNHSEIVYRYPSDNPLHPETGTTEKLLVADSFLVNNSQARAPELHAQRFMTSCRELAGLETGQLTRFWSFAMLLIPDKGLWFPRLELTGKRKQPSLQIRIRPTPELQSEARLIHSDMQDKRRNPRHKGPDIMQLISQKKSLSALGADEGILCTPAHYLLEGFFSSILWWENDTLCRTPPDKRILPSVTATLVMQLAASRGIPTANRFRKRHELNGCETWAVNALHGIRRAVNWPLAPWRTSARMNLDDWQRELNDYALRPIRAGLCF